MPIVVENEELEPKVEEVENKLPSMEVLDEELGKYLEIVKYIHDNSMID